MDRASFHRLLEKAAAGELTSAEEAELARALEDPDHRAQAEQELGAARARIGRMLAYRDALDAPPEPMPEKQRQRFEHLIAELGAGRPAAPEPRPRHRRAPVPFFFALALAACIAAVIWVNRPAVAVPPQTIELALMARENVVRGGAARINADLGAPWRVVEMKNFSALHAWTRAAFPPEVQARIWIDEEKELLRARVRRADGNHIETARALNRTDPVEAQLRDFAASSVRE